MKPEQHLAMVLTDLRKKKGLSQRQLAAFTHLDRTYISLVELGKRNPTVKVLFLLADALDIKASRILAMIDK